MKTLAWAAFNFLCGLIGSIPRQDPNYSEGGVSHQTAQLNKFHPKPKKKDVHYLVDSDKKKDKDKEEENDQNQDQELEDQEEGQVRFSKSLFFTSTKKKK